MPREEIMPGVYVGSEIGDLNRRQKELIGKLLNETEDRKTVLRELRDNSDRRMELLMPKRLRKR